MVMSGTTMGNEVAAAVKAIWDNAPDTHEPGNTYSAEKFWQTVCEKIVAHIQANAKCSGIDSNGDSHSTVGIT